MAAQDDYPNMWSYYATDSPENGTLAVEMSDALATIDELRARVADLEAALARLRG